MRTHTRSKFGTWNFVTYKPSFTCCLEVNIFFKIVSFCGFFTNKPFHCLQCCSKQCIAKGKCKRTTGLLEVCIIPSQESKVSSKNILVFMNYKMISIPKNSFYYEQISQ